VDTFISFFRDDGAEEIPEHIGQDVLLSDEAKAAGDTVDYDIVVFASKGVKTREQIFYELV